MNESEKTRILLVDDHALLRHGLSAVLSLQKDFAVVGEATDGAEAVKLAARLHPDIVIMDLAMPKTDGVEATRLIRENLPDTKVMILTSFGMSAEPLMPAPRVQSSRIQPIGSWSHPSAAFLQARRFSRPKSGI